MTPLFYGFALKKSAWDGPMLNRSGGTKNPLPPSQKRITNPLTLTSTLLAGRSFGQGEEKLAQEFQGGWI